MAMKKVVPAANPAAYLGALDGWRKPLIEKLRKAALSAGPLDERIKWGHLVYFHSGPVLLIRAEDERVLFGFWRGKRMRDLDERLKGNGKYELATIELREGDTLSAAKAKEMVVAAIALNDSLGDPTAKS